MITQESGGTGAQTSTVSTTPVTVAEASQALGALTISTTGGTELGQASNQQSEESLRDELQRLKANLAWFYQHPAYQVHPPPNQFPPPRPQTAVLFPAHGNTNPLLNHPGNPQNGQQASRPPATTLPQVTMPLTVTQGLPPYTIPFGTAPLYTPGLSVTLPPTITPPISQTGVYPPAYPGAQPSSYPPLPPPQGYSYGEAPYQAWPAGYNPYSLYGAIPPHPGTLPWRSFDFTPKGRHPFVQSIMLEYVPLGFQMPFEITPYEGESDPQDHINTFNSAMAILGMTDGQQCRIFSSTLKGAALRWFSLLPPNSIYTFEQLASLFTTQFASSKEYKKNEDAFIGFQQGDTETLQEYLARFSKMALQIRGLQDSVAIFVIKLGMRASPFYGDLNRQQPTTLAELMARAEKFITEENAQIAKKSMREFLKGKGDKKRDKPLSSGDKGKEPKEQRRRSPPRPFIPASRYHTHTPLNRSHRGVLEEIYASDMLKFPAPPKRRKVGSSVDQTKYCQFHKDHGHNTDDCITLKDQIEDLIRQGKLNKYVRRGERSSDRQKEGAGKTETRGVIDVITGGIQKGTSSQAQSKKRIEKSILTLEYLARSRDPPKADHAITFNCADIASIDQGHDDPMVISAIVANFEVKRVLVDQGSSADIMYYDTFRRLGLEEKELKAFPGTLIGFSGTQVPAEGIYHARVTIGTPPKTASAQADFIVVSAPSAYNMILGRPSLNKLKAIVSTAHLVMKFPTDQGTGEVKADQKLARACYASSLSKTLKAPKAHQSEETAKKDGEEGPGEGPNNGPSTQ